MYKLILTYTHAPSMKTEDGVEKGWRHYLFQKANVSIGTVSMMSIGENKMEMMVRRYKTDRERQIESEPYSVVLKGEYISVSGSDGPCEYGIVRLTSLTDMYSKDVMQLSQTAFKQHCLDVIQIRDELKTEWGTDVAHMYARPSGCLTHAFSAMITLSNTCDVLFWHGGRDGGIVSRVLCDINGIKFMKHIDQTPHHELMITTEHIISWVHRSNTDISQ